MPDIAMCKGGDCPQKDDCYRYVAVPSPIQSWFMSPPFFNGKCDYFYSATIPRGTRPLVQTYIRRHEEPNDK